MLTQDNDLYMASLDIDVLFPNAPLGDTIDFSIKKLFQNPETLVKGISKTDSPDLLDMATK